MRSEVYINVNINLMHLEKKSGKECRLKFIYTVNYNPSVATVNIRGSQR